MPDSYRKGAEVAPGEGAGDRGWSRRHELPLTCPVCDEPAARVVSARKQTGATWAPDWSHEVTFECGGVLRAVEGSKPGDALADKGACCHAYAVAKKLMEAKRGR